MIAEIRFELLRDLIALGLHYPSMRFGQLVEFACAMASDDVSVPLSSVTDAEIIQAIARHRHSLDPDDRGLEIGPGLCTLTPARGQLVDALRDAGERYPDLPTTQLIVRLANLAHVSLYDAEDQQLADAASNPGLLWFEDYTDRLERFSTIQTGVNGETFACPCCRYSTLHERGGFEICPVCYWEDDGQDDSDADNVRGGPNGPLSLAAARVNYKRIGACDRKYLEHVRSPRPEENHRNGE